MSTPVSSTPPTSGPDDVQDLLASEQRDRARDRGHYNQYGMRDDARKTEEPGRLNPGNGDHPRRFGSGGDLSTYANRAGDSETPERDASSDAPAHKPGP